MHQYHEMLSSAWSASGRVLKHAAMTNLTAITVCMPEIYHQRTYLKVNINLDTTGVSVLFI